MTKVAIIGPGALGCLFAARLTQSGVKTYLLDYNPKRAASLQKRKVTVETEDGEYTERPTVTTNLPAGLDLVLVLTKAYSTASLHLPAATPTLTLQNGLGNAESLAALLGSANVLAGATSEAVTWLDLGRIRHVAQGRTVFGAWTSCPTDTPFSILKQAGFDVSVTDTPGQVIWEKVVINAGINPLTAILNVPNGALLRLKHIRELMRDLVIEATKAAGAEGYRFPHSMVEETERICQLTAKNISSMLQDIRNKKRTEIDAISGEILQRAQSASIPVPRTRVVYQLVRGLESA